MASAVGDTALAARQRGEKWRKAKRMAPLYLFLLFPMTAVFIFHYIPIYGVQIAFKDFQIGRGIWASPWAGFVQFEMLFSNPFFGRIMRNTVILSLLRIGFAVPAPLLLALLINEVGTMPVKRTIQSISYLPHFMSWVVLSGMLFEVLSPQRGLVALAANLFGTPSVNVFTDGAFFRPLLVASDIWKEAGWGAIIYLAAIASIDPELYEASSIDGANRLQRAIHITIPSLVPVPHHPAAAAHRQRHGGRLRSGAEPVHPARIRGRRHHRHLRVPGGTDRPALRFLHRGRPVQERHRAGSAARRQRHRAPLQ